MFIKKKNAKNKNNPEFNNETYTILAKVVLKHIYVGIFCGCISEPFEWIDVFQAWRPGRVLGKLFTESQGIRRLWQGEVGYIC